MDRMIVTESSSDRKQVFVPIDADFGSIVLYAVKYALTDENPISVVNYVKSVIPYLDSGIINHIVLDVFAFDRRGLFGLRDDDREMMVDLMKLMETELNNRKIGGKKNAIELFGEVG